MTETEKEITLKDCVNHFEENCDNALRFHIFLAVISGLCPSLMLITVPITLACIPYETTVIPASFAYDLTKYSANKVNHAVNAAFDCVKNSASSVVNALAQTTQAPKKDVDATEKSNSSLKEKETQNKTGNVYHLNNATLFNNFAKEKTKQQSNDSNHNEYKAIALKQ